MSEKCRMEAGRVFKVSFSHSYCSRFKTGTLEKRHFLSLSPRSMSPFFWSVCQNFYARLLKLLRTFFPRFIPRSKSGFFFQRWAGLFLLVLRNCFQENSLFLSRKDQPGICMPIIGTFYDSLILEEEQEKSEQSEGFLSCSTNTLSYIYVSPTTLIHCQRKYITVGTR